MAGPATATDRLKLAVYSGLVLEDMRAALEAGATTGGLGMAYAVVCTWCGPDEATRAARQVAALELLTEHGCLSASEMTDVLVLAVQQCSAKVVQPCSLRAQT